MWFTGFEQIKKNLWFFRFDTFKITNGKIIGCDGRRKSRFGWTAENCRGLHQPHGDVPDVYRWGL